MTRRLYLLVVVAGLVGCALAGVVARESAAAQAASPSTQFILDGFPDQIEIRAELANANLADAALQLRLLPDGEPTVLDADVDGASLHVVVQTGEPTSAWNWLPVGAELEYTWIVNSEPMEPGRWRYLDPRYEWGRAEDVGVVLWRPGSNLQAIQLAGHAAGALELVADLLETPVEQPISIVVWPSSTAAAGGLPTSLFGGQPPFAPRISAASTHGEHLIHVFRSTGGEIRNAVSGVVMDTAAHPHADQIPMWLRVAVGLWSQGPMNGAFLRRAGSVVVLDHEDYYSFDELEDFPVTWQFQALYFGQSGGMLSWMLQDWGPPALVDLFQGVSDGTEFYSALEAVYGYDRDQFIAEFTKNAERSLLLTWPYIESETPPFWERLNIGTIMAIVVGVIALAGGGYIVYRLLE